MNQKIINMTSRERIIKALNLKIPDRVPISTYELVGYNSKSFENSDPSYSRLMNIIREKTDCICMWNPNSNETFYGTAFNVDLQEEKYKDNDKTVFKRIIKTSKGVLTQTTQTIDNVYTVWQTEHWCKNIDDVDIALSIPYKPVEYDFSDFTRIKNEVGENGIIMATIPDALLLAADLMEFGDFTLWALTETDSFERAVNIMHERNMENLRRMLNQNVVDLYRICGPEYATPPYLPPIFFRRYVLPFIAEMVDLIHNCGSKVRIHCHGRINQILDMIADSGADAIDPCEAPPDGDIMLSEVKKRVGKKICIFGNIQLKLLENSNIDDIHKSVKDCMDSAKDGGGFVIMPTAAPINTPLSKKTEENYFAYIEAALKYGTY